MRPAPGTGCTCTGGAWAPGPSAVRQGKEGRVRGVDKHGLAADRVKTGSMEQSGMCACWALTQGLRNHFSLLDHGYV